MPHITLTDEQSQIVTQALEAIEIRDQQGKVLGRVPPPREQDILAEAQRRLASNQPRYPSQVVQARLQKLADAVERENLDLPAALALLERLRAEDGV